MNVPEVILLSTAWAMFDVSKTQNYRIMAYFEPCYLDVYITTE